MSEPIVESRTVPSAASDSFTVPAWVVMVGFIVGLTVAHVAIHQSVHGRMNLSQAVLAFFLVINLLVNFWELGLYFTADEIREEYLSSRERFEGKPLERMNEVFGMRIPVSKLLSFHSWTGIWSSYCLFDPGYSRKGSFGYNIDVGNGFSTILPATLFSIGMTFEVVPARVLGMIGIAMFWQMLYGTIVYLFQFFANDRHVGHNRGDLFTFVASTNGLWFIFPIWGIAASVALVESNGFAFFR